MGVGRVRFGFQFFPDVVESQKPPAAYYDDAMRLISYCDVYGYSHVRTVEHYFIIGGDTVQARLCF